MAEEFYQNIPRLYTALAEWGACMVYCFILNRKVSGRRFGIYSAVTLVWLGIFLQLTGEISIRILWLTCMFVAVMSMFLFLYLTCSVPVTTTACCCAQAFLLAEFAASLEWQLRCFFESMGLVNIVFDIVLLCIIYGLVFAAAFYIVRPIMKGEFLLNVSARELVSAVLISLAAFGFSNLSFIYQYTPFSNLLIRDIFNTRTLVDLGGLAIMYAYFSRIYELNAEKELASINTMLQKQYDHYRNYQESIDMLNMKYHDLKHQIAGLRAEIDAGEKERWLDAMETELDENEVGPQTGNSVLDTVLEGKLMYCQAHDITLTYVIDGALLNFMHVTDLCTIFGNALDNAIESVILVEDPDKRLIHVLVTAQKGFILIRVENYCEHELALDGDYPVTTKADSENHGIGLKSIRYSVEKYNGSMSYSFENQWFELKLLFPNNMQADQEAP